MVQVSGLRARYDLSKPVGARLVSLEIGGRPIDDHQRYRVTTNSFLAEGGDGYAAFRGGQVIGRDAVVSDILTDYIKRAPVVTPPDPGRLLPV